MTDTRLPGGAESKDLFDVVVAALVSKSVTLEDAIDTMYEYGVQHGETLKSIKDSYKKANKQPLGVKRKPDALEGGINGQRPPGSSQSLQHTQQSSSGSSSDKELSAKRVKSSSSADSDVVNGHSRPALPAAKEYIGVETSVVSDPRGPVRMYTASLKIYGKVIPLGNFSNPEAAAVAHDRALLRTVGPKHCAEGQLNNPLEQYAKEPLEGFARYDSAIRAALFGASWSGLKDCDFSFLVLGK